MPVGTSVIHEGSWLSETFWMIIMRALNVISLILLIVGGLNWGLVGLFQFDLVAALFGGSDSTLSRLVYILVGVSALWQIKPLFQSFSTAETIAQRR
jgi:uncharacterized protein